MFFLFLLRVLFQLTHAAAEVKDDQPPLILVSLDGMDWRSILTGLYPESHGIVDNVFWDPDYGEQFIFGYDCSNFDPKFYNASEPI
ncbi:unnamed protein product [Pocillopora meandrina]|uniref:Uncharacterized protein n=1 Tax=Pocillopora meandrina TaxID=46732 RepID=A0AAU9WJZ6_9CNID|nr:unnamed protein product [Pocillopora meandrina]